MTVNEWRGTENWGDEFGVFDIPVDIPVGKPRMTDTIVALTRYPTADREGTAELVEVLRLTCEAHFSLEPDADRQRRYGRCAACAEWWPCPAFNAARYAAVEWLVNASNAIMRRSGSLGPALPVGGKPAPPDVELLECYQCVGECHPAPRVPPVVERESA